MYVSYQDDDLFSVMNSRFKTRGDIYFYHPDLILHLQGKVLHYLVLWHI